MDPALQRFFEEMIDSFEKLEMVRCVRLMPERAWTLDSLAERVGSSGEHVRASLLALTRSGLLARGTQPDQYVAGSAYVALVERMLRVYDEDPLSIMRLVNELAVRRIRSMAARTFADSFLIKRKHDDPGD